MSMLNWYAIKVYYRREAAVCEEIRARGIEVYHQDIIPAFVFVHCTEEQIKDIRGRYWEKALVYKRPGEKDPAVVPDREMTAFILVTSSGSNGLLYLGDDKAEYHQGDRVRVTGGPFKGAEGYIKRIKRDRRLVVSINGIAAVATTYIPPQMLEKVQAEPEQAQAD